MSARIGMGPPGKAGFVAVAPVWHSAGPVLALAQLGMIPFCGVGEWAALLRGRGEPGWTFHLMDEGTVLHGDRGRRAVGWAPS